jgi:protein-S-isoprenylcysteine O-methyltransferase Ste14
MQLSDFFRKPRFVFVYIIFIWFLISSNTTEFLFRIGIAIVLLGEIIRLWANGYVGCSKVNWSRSKEGNKKIGRLITAGPYAFVRHPLYLGTLIMGAGFCIMFGEPLVAIVALGCFLWLYGKKIKEEEERLAFECGQPYELYRKKVPCLFPFRKRFTAREGEWSWNGILASKEWKTCIWSIIVFFIVYLREEIIQEREFLATDKWFKQLFVLSMMLILVSLDLIFELVIHRKKRTLEKL